MYIYHLNIIVATDKAISDTYVGGLLHDAENREANELKPKIE